MRLSKVWLVLRREFRYNLSRRSYLFTAFGVPLFMFGIFFVAFTFASDAEDPAALGTIGLVDNAGVSAVLDDLSTGDVTFEAYESAETARAAVQDDDLHGYFVIPADYLSTGNIDYVSQAGLPETLRGEIDTLLRQAIALSAGPELPTARLADPANMEIQLLGEDEAIESEQAILRFLVPIGFGFLIVFNVMIASQFLMTGVSEEKENRIIEILVTSIRPLELIAGKILGLGGLALLQVIFWAGAGLAIGVASGRADVLAEITLDPTLLILGIVYFILTFSLYASIMVGVGAATSAEQESRQIASIFVLIGLLPPLYGLVLILNNPQGVFATTLALFPMTSALTNLILLGMGEAQTWLLIASVVVLLASTVAVMWLSGIIFRVGMLLYGQRLSPQQILQALRGAYS
ncbi:MAG: ABC transporter permease [Anaerolineales bacterium]